MPAIVLATADESLRLSVLSRLAALGHTARVSTSWGDAVSATVEPSTELLLLDAELTCIEPKALRNLSRSLPHSPELRWIRGAGKPLKPVDDLKRVLRDLSNPLWSPYERRLLPLAGLGTDVLQVLHSAAHNPLPVRLQGDRGTGKEWLARHIHRLAWGERPFVVVKPGDDPVIRGGQHGTVYLENLDRHDADIIVSVMSLASATGWKLLAGSRQEPAPALEGHGWTHLPIKPLRERPKDLKPLARLYLEEYTRRLGLPKRRITVQLWALMERYDWPGNQRELESFVVQAATSARGPWLSPTHVPERILTLLDPTVREQQATVAFEQMVEERLRPLVVRYEPAEHAPSLHRLVIDATERALFRLVLARTGGNQKSAAELLGLARNTLRSRVARLDPLNEGDTA